MSATASYHPQSLFLRDPASQTSTATHHPIILQCMPSRADANSICKQQPRPKKRKPLEWLPKSARARR